jgi:hypothetical protein
VKGPNTFFFDQYFDVDIMNVIQFRILKSPIVIQLTGHNTVYGRNQFLNIQAKGTYDIDIDGMNYFHPFTFIWNCPDVIPAENCLSNSQNFGNVDSFATSTSLLLGHGMQYNKFYKFQVKVLRLLKKSQMDFWVKIVDVESVPQIGRLLEPYV